MVSVTLIVSVVSDQQELLDGALLGTTLVEGVVLLAGQFVIVGAQDVIVTMLVTFTVMVDAASAFKIS